MNRIATALAAVSFAFAATLAQAQAPSPAKPDRGQMREGMHAMHEACKDKPDRRACMTEQYCAKSSDKAKCEAQAKEAAARRDKIREACKDKQGDAYRSCVREQRGKS